METQLYLFQTEDSTSSPGEAPVRTCRSRASGPECRKEAEPAPPSPSSMPAWLRSYVRGSSSGKTCRESSPRTVDLTSPPSSVRWSNSGTAARGGCWTLNLPDQDVTQEQAEHFTEEVDRVLQEINMEYKAKRVSLRLKIPETYRLIPNSLEAFRAQCNAEGSRDEQFKLNLLSENEVRHTKFKQLLLP